MTLESLAAPLPGDKPAGEDCVSEIHSQNLALMAEYLAERAIQKARERAADEADLEEGEARNRASLREEGRRRLLSNEGILKDVLKLVSVNAEQVAKILRDKTSALLTQRGKDLRVVALLGAACTQIDGLDGYAAILDLAATLLRNFHGDLHPMPDADDPADVWERANAVSDLLSGDAMMALLGPVVVVDARHIGRLTLAELVGGLHNDMPVAETTPEDLAMALGEIGVEPTQQLLARLQGIETSVASLRAVFDAGTLPVPRLTETLRRLIAKISAAAGSGAAPAVPADVDPSDDTPAPSRARPVAQGGLQTREDARRVLQDLIRFLEKLEPSHPAPLLLKRADRLLGMSFFDIIKDMAPGAVSDIERIVGAEPSE